MATRSGYPRRAPATGNRHLEQEAGSEYPERGIAKAGTRREYTKRVPHVPRVGNREKVPEADTLNGYPVPGVGSLERTPEVGTRSG